MEKLELQIVIILNGVHTIAIHKLNAFDYLGNIHLDFNIFHSAAGGYGSPLEPGVLVHNAETGILSMTYRGQTRAICDDSFGNEEASVAC